MLSEIAQEHGVEWDLSAAARTLLPPPPIPSPLFTAAGQPQGNAAGAPGQVRGSGGEEARCVCVWGGHMRRGLGRGQVQGGDGEAYLGISCAADAR